MSSKTFEFAIPNKWRNQAIVQGKDIMSMTNNKFIKFCECMELIESQSPEEERPKRKEKASNDHKKKNRGEKGSRPDNGKVCMLHGPGHSSEECKALCN